VLAIVWALVVWQWQNPFTALYTLWKHHQLAAQYAKRASAFRATAPSDSSLTAERRNVAAEAQTYRVETSRGEAIGRIVVPRMGVNMILVDDTDHDSPTKGPGTRPLELHAGREHAHLQRGHRTTYLAPFSHLDQMRNGDSITLEVPYGTFRYRVSGQRIRGGAPYDLAAAAAQSQTSRK
jgi:sortase A